MAYTSPEKGFRDRGLEELVAGTSRKRRNSSETSSLSSSGISSCSSTSSSILRAVRRSRKSKATKKYRKAPKVESIPANKENSVKSQAKKSPKKQEASASTCQSARKLEAKKSPEHSPKKQPAGGSPGQSPKKSNGNKSLEKLPKETDAINSPDQMLKKAIKSTDRLPKKPDAKKSPAQTFKKPDARKDDSSSSTSSNSSDEDDDVFAVERIDEEQKIEGRTYYYVKWEGWDESDNTWEPLENLKNCKAVLADYELRKASKSKPGEALTPAEKRERELEETRKHMKAYGIFEIWPGNKKPLRVEGVMEVDKKLTYVVRKDIRRFNSKPLDRSNAILVHSDGFKHEYPELVIEFFQARIKFGDGQCQDVDRSCVEQ